MDPRRPTATPSRTEPAGAGEVPAELRRLLDDLSLLALVRDAQALRYANPAFYAFTGYTPDELQQPGFRARLLTPAVLQRLDQRLPQLFQGAGEREPEIVIEYVLRSGEHRQVRLSESIVRDADGRARWLVAVGRDITQHVQVAAELRRAHRTQALVSEVLSAILHHDDELALYRSVCSAIVEQGGYAVAHVTLVQHDAEKTLRPVAWAGPASQYLPALQLHWDEHKPSGRGPAGMAVRQRQPVVFNTVQHGEVLGTWQDHAQRQAIHAYLCMPMIFEGEVIGLLSMNAYQADAFDEAEVNMLQQVADELARSVASLRLRAQRDAAELARRDASERLRFVAQAVGIGTWQVDLERRRFEGDALLASLLRLPEGGRVLPRAWRQRLDAGERRQLRQQLRDPARQRLGHELELALPGEPPRTLSIIGTIERDAQGRPLRAGGVCIDITERRNAVLARQQQLAAERANQAKSMFLSRMSHELRTPLNAILGFTQLLAHPDGSGLSPLQRDHVLRIESAGWHLLELIDEVMDISRIEQGALSLKLSAVPLLPLVDEVLALQAEPARAAGVALSLRREPQVCIDTVWADATRLRQVLLNLVSNAVKYNRAGGRVELVLGAHGGDASLLRLQVIDTGRGMDAQQLAHLFEPFNRMGMESSGIPGTGIGLLISRRLVELMGGAIEVSSRAGEGSNFTLVLPLAVPAPDVAAPPPARVPRRDERVRGRVLYIEDNPVNAVLVEGYLALRPHVMLQIAVDGAKGLASAQADPPDVVLLDLNLPDIDGFEVVRRLRAHPATAHVPCVAVTASALAAERDRALAGGFNAFWTKPLSAADFLAALDRLLGGPVR